MVNPISLLRLLSYLDTHIYAAFFCEMLGYILLLFI
jgi:hypothetical protein